MNTSWGLFFETTKHVNETWSDYNKTVARAHLSNYALIFINEYGCPIDNEYDLMGIEEEFPHLINGN